MVSKQSFAKALRMLLDQGFQFTVIGGTVIEVALGSKDLGPDIDLFAEEPNVFMEEEYYSVAEELGWGIGQTWLGTPSLIARLEEEFPIEFYDNLFDFNVPEEMLQRAVKMSVGGIRVKMITVEDHIVLKANAGRSSDMERLKELARYAKKGKLKVDNKKLLDAAKLFHEEKVILRRLREAGFKV
ncbi:MAG: nucleotidyltransferase [Desulfurococcales archaeon]|nr:nucleotidyltransferase [Desulfurococcales archaeon]